MQSLHWTIPPILEGMHVTLEPLQPHHAEDLLAAASDGELWNLWYTSVPGPETVWAYLARAIADREAGTAMPFLVRDASGEPVGSTRFFRMDPVVPSLEIGYTWYSARVQRSALNTEAKRLLLGHAFDAIGCSVVELRTHVMNHRSRAAIERLGAHFDGRASVHRLHAPDSTTHRAREQHFAVGEIRIPFAVMPVESLQGVIFHGVQHGRPAV
jgi:RimJ/RimL family protein N-acetyltransferase